VGGVHHANKIRQIEERRLKQYKVLFGNPKPFKGEGFASTHYDIVHVI
jgi:hypothetical protein